MCLPHLEICILENEVSCSFDIASSLHKSATDGKKNHKKSPVHLTLLASYIQELRATKKLSLVHLTFLGKVDTRGKGLVV